MAAVPPALLAPAGLVGGFAAARYSGKRALGGAVFAAAGAWCLREWARSSGPAAAGGLAVLYAASMGGSHPLARKLGPWASVLAVSAVNAVTSEILTRRAARRYEPVGSNPSR
jgi:apolipoprotein N-acyltransferase